MEIITRFAPSPTGLLHAGNYRTALFSYLFARQNKGKFILRIEDTDKARSKKEYEDNIIESLAWLGLEYDEMHRQSERTDVHCSYIQKLIDTGFAYVSKETPKEPGERDEVIRFKNPNKKVSWDDLIRGKIEFDTTELGDFVIARSMTEPVFHLVVVTDDIDMGVTHIIRGEDHISNTPRHILIYEALGATVPKYAHLPLLLSKDRSKLSKRKGALPITSYRDRGFRADAVINYMALLGWNPGGDKEIYSKEELIERFSLEDIQKSGAIFDEAKLLWINREYMKKMSDNEFLGGLAIFAKDISSRPGGIETVKKLVPLLREKSYNLQEASDLISPTGELSFAFEVKPYDPSKLIWKQDSDKSIPRAHIEKVISIVETLKSDTVSAEEVKSLIWPYAEEKGRGSVLWPVRYALTGADKSPDPFNVISILGRDETIRRLNNAIKLL